MDNLTHSLLGATLAEAFLPREARAARGVFMAFGIVAANLPDIDVAYTWITVEPLGDLLHHRGHTHTVVGLLALGLLLAGAAALVPAVRRLDVPLRKWLALLGGVALGSHLLLDSWNSYGIHPFWPFDSRWFYGDAVFIFEPWLWMTWGVAVVVNTVRSWTRALVAGAVTLLPATMAVLGVVSWTVLAWLVLVGVALAALALRVPPRTRAAAALAAGALVVGALFVLRAEAHQQVDALLRPELRSEVLDVVLSPEPADPRCWSVIAIEKDEAHRQFVLHRGTLSLLPSRLAPEDCALHRLWRIQTVPWSGQAQLARAEPLRQSLDRLRHYARNDCRVAAWMQFGRAPFFAQDGIRDLRYEMRSRENFTAMEILEGGACPSFVTDWGLPRADLLD
jgi:inner membrane protein